MRKGAKKLGKPVKRKIAHGLAQGKAYGEVAAAAGVSYSSVAHLASDPEVLEIREQIEARHAAELDALYAAVLTSCAKDVVDGDATTRRQAREQAMGILAATDRRPRGREISEHSGGFTLEQIFAFVSGGSE